MEAPEKLYIALDELTEDDRTFVLDHDVDYPICTEYVRTDAFIDKACEWIKENITNNPNANSVIVRNRCVTLGMLIEDFKSYMKGE